MGQPLDIIQAVSQLFEELKNNCPEHAAAASVRCDLHPPGRSPCPRPSHGHGGLASAAARKSRGAEDCAPRSRSVSKTCFYSFSLCRIRKEWKGIATESQEAKSTKKVRASRHPSWAVWQHHLQESPASWLQHVHLLGPKPGAFEVQDASALFRRRVTSPLRAQLKT